MFSTHTAELDLPQLPLAARQGHIVPDLSCRPLLSMGQLCDAGCNVSFDTHSVIVTFRGQTVLTGIRKSDTRLWEIALPTAPTCSQNAPNAVLPETALAIQPSTASPATIVAFAHAALFSPALSTLETALRRNLLPGIAGLTLQGLQRHPPVDSVPMIKGHLDQTRQHQRSTKRVPAPPMCPSANLSPLSLSDDPTADTFPAAPKDGARTHFCYAAVHQATGQIYTDQTGRFVTPSSSGNNYILVLYDYDSNFIMPIPMKSRSAEHILAAYETGHQRLCAAGLRPQLQRLDNEASTILKQFMRSQEIDYQLVPPHVHRRNAAERAIRTFKNHFTAGLCSVDKDFPLHLWDKLLPQAELSLNLLRGSRLNPKLSAWAYLHGTFDFN